MSSGAELCSDALGFVRELLKAPNTDAGGQHLNSRHVCPAAALNRLCVPLTASGS